MHFSPLGCQLFLLLLSSISVEDLRNTRPMENEAEHYLIKALETRDPLVPAEGSKGGEESSSAAVLSNIAPEDLDAFRVEPAVDNASVGSSSNRSGSNRGSNSNRGIGSHSSSRPSLVRRDKSSTRGPAPVRHRRTETVSALFCNRVSSLSSFVGLTDNLVQKGR